MTAVGSPIHLAGRCPCTRASWALPGTRACSPAPASPLVPCTPKSPAAPPAKKQDRTEELPVHGANPRLSPGWGSSHVETCKQTHPCRGHPSGTQTLLPRTMPASPSTTRAKGTHGRGPAPPWRTGRGQRAMGEVTQADPCYTRKGRRARTRGCPARARLPRPARRPPPLPRSLQLRRSARRCGDGGDGDRAAAGRLGAPACTPPPAPSSPGCSAAMPAPEPPMRPAPADGPRSSPGRPPRSPRPAAVRRRAWRPSGERRARGAEVRLHGCSPR